MPRIKGTKLLEGIRKQSLVVMFLIRMDSEIVQIIAIMMDNSRICFESIGYLSGVYQNNWKGKHGGTNM